MSTNIHPPDDDPLSEMEQALDRAIELSVGSKRYPITNGHLVSEQTRRYRYTFTLMEGVRDLPDGTDLQLTSLDQATPLLVELSSTTDETVTITVPQRLTKTTLANAELVIDRAFLLRKLREALLRESTSAHLGLKLLGVLDCDDEEAAPHLVESIQEVFQPDEAQHQALRRALASELLLILGPPGTGKTGVLAAIALLHATLFRHRVLIVSHTNIALDNAIKRLVGFMRACSMEQFLDQQRLVRCGEPHLTDLLSDDYRNVTLPLIVADCLAYLDGEITRIERKRDRLLVQLVAHREELPKQVQLWRYQAREREQQRTRAQQALVALEAEEQARLVPIKEQLTPRLDQQAFEEQTMKRARATWEEAERHLHEVQRASQEQWLPYQSASQQLERLRSHHPFFRFFLQAWTGEKEQDLTETVRALSSRLRHLEEQMRALQRAQAEATDTYQQAKRRKDALDQTIAYWERERHARPAEAVKQQAILTRQLKELAKPRSAVNPREVEMQQEITAWEKEVAQLGEALAQLDQQRASAKRDAARQVIEQATIVGATLTSLTLNPHLFNQEWEVVIVDEGSMAPPPAVVVAANRARRHFILIGDPLQLAPVCRFKEEQVRRWLGVDVYTHGHYTLDEAEKGTHHCVLLPYQSRMHSDICDLVREPIYKGLLKDRNPHAPRPTFHPEPGSAVVLYDTGGIRLSRAQRPKSGGSRYNEYHADLDLVLARLVLSDIADRGAECLGIVTPYKAQRDHLNERVRGTELERLCRIGTVHAYQGLEFDVLIFDTVESPGLSVASFLRGAWGSEPMRLLNVAVTRARHKLLIVANLPYLLQEPSWSMLPQIMKLAARKRCVAADTLQRASAR